MIPKSSTIIKIITFLIINLGFLDESQATKKPTPNGPSASPLASPLEQKLSPQYTEFLNACQKRMSEECADQIVGNIFKDKKVSKPCCSKLVYMGPDCHKALVDREKELIKGHVHKKKIISRSQDLWKKCEKTAPPTKDNNYPKLPPREYLPGYENFLKECAKKITEKCETEVVDAIFKKNKTVDKGCCSKLLKMGIECHKELLKGLKNLVQYKKDEGEVKVKSDQVWKHCKNITGHK
ncbi:hypothetical protein Pfo_019588 [Paulownia fortunei]|nr:hypothetical protein Pfo_019588 [Paulownia fortunei]